MTATAERTKGVKLTRADLRNFDAEATALVMDATEAGWTGQIGNRGHVFMFAPDGVTTMSIARSSRGRTGKNARSEFTRWQREQESKPATGASFGTPTPLPDVDVGLMGLVKQYGPMATTVLAGIKRSEKTQAFFTAWRDKHPTNPLAPMAVGLPGETLEGADPTAWYVYDKRRPPTLIDHGPGITEQDAWNEVIRATTPNKPAPAPVEAPTAGDDVRIFKCEQCGKEYQKAGALNLHITAKHPIDLECPECGRIVKGQGGLGAHMRSHRKKAEAAAAPEAEVTVDDTTVAPPPDVLTEHLVNLPEGDDAELMVAQIRSVVAAGLVTEVRNLRAENERLRAENEKLTTQAGEWEAKYAIIREAMSV